MGTFGVVLVGISGTFNGSGAPASGITINMTNTINPMLPDTSGITGGRGLVNQPPAVQTQTAIDVNELQNAFGSHIPVWGSQLASNVEMHISPDEVGLANANNVRDVVYGKCGAEFYIFVVYKGVLPNTDTSGANAGGYMYTTSGSPLTCRSLQYSVVDFENDGGGWYFTYFRS
jgi:hypothetical protein